MEELKQLTVYVATDGSASSNEIKKELAEKLAEDLIENGTVRVVYHEFASGNTVYAMDAWVPSHD